MKNALAAAAQPASKFTSTAVIYARVSKQRDEGVSLESQIEQCTLRARQLGARVIKVFVDEGISGRETHNRRDFLKAKVFCEAANVDYFITWSTSRFARNMLELFLSSRELREVGTKLECLNADIDEETDAGFMNKAIHGLFDEMKSREVARDTLRSQKMSAASGYFTGGRVPFGYRSVNEAGEPARRGDEMRHRLEADPATAPIIVNVFQLCLGGLGAQAIAAKLNGDGRLRNGKTWGKNTVSHVLKCEAYTGVKIFNKTHRRTRKLKPAAEWIRVPSHPALINRDDFERVQAMLEERTPHHQRGGTARSVFLFTGLAVCGICSGRLQIGTGKGRGGTLYSYYRCVAHLKGAPRCLFRQVRADLFDQWMLGEILEHVMTREVVQQAVEDILTAGADWTRDRAARRAQIVADMREQEGRRDRLFELLEATGKATPDLALVSERLRQRTAELEQLQRQLIALEAMPGPLQAAKVDPEIAAEVMREVITAADTKKKRAFLGAFIERMTVDVQNVTVNYRPETLLTAGASTSVRSDCRWLPVGASLRTRKLVLERPCLSARRSPRPRDVADAPARGLRVH